MGTVGCAAPDVGAIVARPAAAGGSHVAAEVGRCAAVAAAAAANGVACAVGRPPTGRAAAALTAARAIARCFAFSAAATTKSKFVTPAALESLPRLVAALCNSAYLHEIVEAMDEAHYQRQLRRHERWAAGYMERTGWLIPPLDPEEEQYWHYEIEHTIS